MICAFCLLALLISAENAGGDVARYQIVAEAGHPPGGEYFAGVVVSLGGVTRHERIIVTATGFVYLEHLDDQAWLWVSGVIRSESSPTKGWDNCARHAGTIHPIWNHVGPKAVLAEVHTPDGMIKISQHRLFVSR